jgi:hypothetical protein
LENLLQKANVTLETSYPGHPEFIAQGDRVLAVGLARGKIKATDKPFEDHWVFDITVRDGKLTNIREYIDRKLWRGPPRWTRAPGPAPSTPIPHFIIATGGIYGRDL